MLNHNLIQQKLNKNAKQLAELEFIYQEIAKRMLDRLDYIKLQPQSILDLGSGLNIDLKNLTIKYPQSKVYILDFALNILNQNAKPKRWFNKLLKKNNSQIICANALQIPLASQTIDLVWSNMLLPYVDDYFNFFKEINRILALGGTFLVSGLSVDSLRELRDLGLSTYNFPDMHIIGDILVKLGFTDPVTDIEYITLEYNSLAQLITDIRLLGCGAALKPHILKRQDYINLYSGNATFPSDKKYTLTLEVFYAHAWKDRVVLDLPPDMKPIQFQRRYTLSS